jgi:tetratricopeptide (TPR) repeat protein
VEAFAATIASRKEHYSPPPKRIPRLTAFSQIDFSEIRRPDDRDLFDLLLYGDIKRDAAMHALSVPGFEESYIIKRSTLGIVLKSILAGKRNVLLHSNLGNGKTVFTEALACELSRKGYHCYSLEKHSDHIEKELDFICSSATPHLLIVENYPTYMNAIKSIQRRRGEYTTLIVTARSLHNDVAFQRLDDVLADPALLEIDLNTLEPEEVLSFISLFDAHGLWGREASLSRKQKIAYISRSGGELVGLLVSLIESKDIQERFRREIELLRKSPKHYEGLLALCVFKIIDILPTTMILSSLLESDVVLRADFKRFPGITEFVRSGASGYRVKSTVLARMILRHYGDPEVVEELLIRMARRSSKLRSPGNVYQELSRLLMMYSNLSVIFPETNSKQSLIKYYEAIKEQENANFNPFFWLQYAIARLAFSEYDAAEQYFATAYSFAKKDPYFQTYQLDNHYARYLLENVITGANLPEAMQSFKRAHSILAKQARIADNQHYPFRVARGYFHFWKVFGGRLSTEDQTYVKKAAGEILRAIESLPDRLRNSRFVIECRNNLREIE